MVQHTTWKSKHIDKVPPNAKILSSTWAMKKKANGIYQACINTRGFEQVDGEHYDENSIAAPVVTNVKTKSLV